MTNAYACLFFEQCSKAIVGSLKLTTEIPVISEHIASSKSTVISISSSIMLTNFLLVDTIVVHRKDPASTSIKTG